MDNTLQLEAPKSAWLKELRRKLSRVIKISRVSIVTTKSKYTFGEIWSGAKCVA